MKRNSIQILLLSLVTVWVVALANDDKKPPLSAAEIISQHLDAAGGKQKLLQFKSRVAIGTIKKENEPEARMAIMSETPNHVAAAYIFVNFDWRLAYDGSNTVFRPKLPRNYVAIESKYREMLASGLMFNSISLYNLLLQPAKGVTFEAKGVKKVKDHDAYVVEVKRSKADSMRLYFDVKSFMWVRTDYGKIHISKEIKPFTNEVVTHGEDDLTVDFYIETSGFRDVDGVKLPFKFEQVVTSPILRQSRSGTVTGTISEYRHNEPIDPAMFQ